MKNKKLTNDEGGKIMQRGRVIGGVIFSVLGIIIKVTGFIGMSVRRDITDEVIQALGLGAFFLVIGVLSIIFGLKNNK